MSRVTHVAAGEGEKLWVVGDTYTLKATGETTGGALALVEASVPVGSGPPPHVHAREDEAYYVLEGELEVLDGDRTFVARPGSFVFIPSGTLHRFRNVGFGTPACSSSSPRPASSSSSRRSASRRGPSRRRPWTPARSRARGSWPRFGLELRLPEAVAS